MHLKLRHGNSNCLAVTVADTHTDTLDTSLRRGICCSTM